jgi:hypothetical protein
VSLIDAFVRNWTGTTPDELKQNERLFCNYKKNDKFASNFTELVYKPMLKLFDILKD